VGIDDRLGRVVDPDRGGHHGGHGHGGSDASGSSFFSTHFKSQLSSSHAYFFSKNEFLQGFQYFNSFETIRVCATYYVPFSANLSLSSKV
jgi:hypothetical protein